MITRTLRKSYVLRLVLLTEMLTSQEDISLGCTQSSSFAIYRRRLNNAAAAQTYSVVIRG